MTLRDLVAVGLGGDETRDSLPEDLCALRGGRTSGPGGEAITREGECLAGGLVEVDGVAASSK
jgi:hypothetical protein